MAIAAGGRDVEARRDVPAEVAGEGCVVGGFGEHGAWPSKFHYFWNTGGVVPANAGTHNPRPSLMRSKGRQSAPPATSGPRRMGPRVRGDDVSISRYPVSRSPSPS